MQHRMTPKAAFVALAVAIAWVASSCAIPLGDLGGPSAVAYAINEGGTIVGVSELPGSTVALPLRRAFLRLPDGTVSELPSLPGADEVGAVDINDAGQVVGLARFGTADPTNGATHLARWPGDGTVEDLGPIGDLDATVRAVDEQGRIVGTTGGTANETNAFVFDPAVGHVEELPDLPDGQSSVALGMNDVGDVVGYQWVDAQVAPVRWDLDAGTATDLTATWGAAALSGINDAGTVVGQARFVTTSPPGSIVQGAILRPGETAPTPLVDTTWAFPIAIDDDEVVVGWDPHAPGGTRAFRWEQSTGLVHVGDPESYAYDVNDRGQVVGANGPRAALFVGLP